MATYTRLELADARAIGRQFGVDVTGLTAIAAGSVNSNYRLETAAGPSYLARIYEEVSRADAEAEAQLVERLATAGIPTPRPAARVDGRGFTVPAPSATGGRPVALFAWQDGEILCQARVTPAAAVRVGDALARLHLAGVHVGAPRPGRFRLEDLHARLQAIGVAPDAELRALAPAIAERLARAAAARDPGLPGGIVHGDLFRDNVLWRDGAIVALLDFESAAAGSWAYDLMVTVLAWCYGADLDLALVRAMLAGYQTVRPLTAAERSALAGEGRIAALRFTITRITDFNLRADRTARVMKDWRRFWTRLASLDALGDAALATLASP
jgi:homoserine kinase type II